MDIFADGSCPNRKLTDNKIRIKEEKAIKAKDSLMEKSLSEKRRQAAAELTQLLCDNDSFSFVRLADGEVDWLLKVQHNEQFNGYQYSSWTGSSCELIRFVRGLEIRHYRRFFDALENCSFLDIYTNIPFVRDNIAHIKLNRNPSLLKNESADTANILYEWTFYELKNYVFNHRCLFASAEAALQRELLRNPQYCKIAESFWPDTKQIWFHQFRDDGRNYSENLDLIKEDLKKDIYKNKIDTIFISLATGAKILCYELAKEIKIRAIDFGSMLRGLTYSATPGYQPVRDCHNPFFFQVTFDVYMDALKRAQPNLTLSAILSKAHAQLMLELQEKRVCCSSSTYGHGRDNIELNLDNFHKSLRSYKQRYSFHLKRNPDLRRLYKEFDLWCLKKGIGVRGKIFLMLVKIKGQLRRLARKLKVGSLYLKFKQRFGHGLKVAYYRDIVRNRILSTKPVTCTTSDICEIHVLTSLSDWIDMLWMLKSFYHYSGCNYSLCIHDDGSLITDVIGKIKKHFPYSRLITRKEADQRLTELIKNYPRCQGFREANNRALKIFDFITYLKTEKMLLLDSDILFFSRPAKLIEIIEDRSVSYNMLNCDWRYGYSVDLEETRKRVDFNFKPLINSGLGLVHKASMPFSWIEDFLGLPNILSHSHRIEQTIFALCSCRFGFVMLPEEYDIYFGKIKRDSQCRHYTGPIRHLMYSEGMRKLIKSGFLKQTGK